MFSGNYDPSSSPTLDRTEAMYLHRASKEKSRDVCVEVDVLNVDSSVESLDVTDISSDTSNTTNSELHANVSEYLKLDEIINDFTVITDRFEKSMYEAIEKSDNCMIPCYNVVCEEETSLSGLTAVIDIGGSTLRICVVQLSENHEVKCIVNKSWIIEDSMKHLDRSFFKWIADNFKSVIDEDLMGSLKNSAGAVNVGLTWSFPIIQNQAPNRGIVSNLGKGFSVSDELKGGDLKDIFETCFHDSDLVIDICAIVNDSISVFIAGAYLSHSKLGLVQGTGVNSCFLIEKESLPASKLTQLKLDKSTNSSRLLINTEASFLGDHLHSYMSPADREMHATWDLLADPAILPPHLTTSVYGVFQPLEVLTSGRYLPEIVRRLVTKFQPATTDTIFTESPQSEYSLTAEHLSKLCTKSEIGNDIADLSILDVVTKAVVQRASIILSAFIIAMIRVTGFATPSSSQLKSVEDTQKLCIAVVGSMLKHFPGYLDLVEETLREKCELLNLPLVEFDFVEDSSIFGAAIAALGQENRVKNL